MPNKSPEQELLDALVLKTNSIDCITKIHASNCNAKNEMDFVIELILNKVCYFLRCEAKVASQSDGSHYGDKNNAVHKLFGELLKGRNIAISPEVQIQNTEIIYGLLIPKRDKQFFQRQFMNIKKSDWNKFGEVFNCKMVLMFDQSNNNLEIYQWEDCWWQDTLLIVL